MYFYECIKLIIFPLFLSFPISGGRYKCTFTNASPACKLDLLTDPAGAKTVPYSLLFVPHISFGKNATKYYIIVFFKCSRPASFLIIFQFFSQAFPSSCPLLAASASDHQKSELKSNLPGIFFYREKPTTCKYVNTCAQFLFLAKVYLKDQNKCYSVCPIVITFNCAIMGHFELNLKDKEPTFCCLQ